MSTQSYHLFSPIVAVKELHYLYLHLPNSVSQDSSKLDQVSGQLLPSPAHEPHPSQSYAPRLRSLVKLAGRLSAPRVGAVWSPAVLRNSCPTPVSGTISAEPRPRAISQSHVIPGAVEGWEGEDVATRDGETEDTV